MTSSDERTSAESKSSRRPHREVADGVQPIGALEQILGKKDFFTGHDRHSLLVQRGLNRVSLFVAQHWGGDPEEQLGFGKRRR